MKKLQAVILFIVIFFVTFFIWKGFFSFPSSAFLAEPVVTPDNVYSPAPLPSPSPKEIIKKPVTLLVPKLKVEAKSESVGMDDQGRMDIPKGVENVAWYNLGVKPGEKGNAVFAGHFDKPDGSPSVFYKLDTLEAGDMFEVVDETGEKRRFEVTEKRVVKTEKFPLQEVFGETNKIRVNLITCGGKWDKTKKEYSERTVVFSELVK